MNRFVTSIATCALALGTSATVAQPAHAIAQRCKSTPYGQFCVVDDSRGYNVQLNYTGSTRTLDFNLWCQNGKKFGDSGSFTAYSGNQYSFVFRVGNQGMCQGVLKNSSGTVIASTPYLNS